MTAAAPSFRIQSRLAPLVEAWTGVAAFLEKGVGAVLDLAIRFWLAKIFFVSGVLKTVNWEVTVFLYANEHPVPGLAPTTAALIGTGIELVCPILLVFGLATRFTPFSTLISRTAVTVSLFLFSFRSRLVATDYPTIADITKERVRRVIKKLNDEDGGKLDLEGSRSKTAASGCLSLPNPIFRVGRRENQRTQMPLVNNFGCTSIMYSTAGRTKTFLANCYSRVASR